VKDILSVPYIISPDESQRRTKALAPLLDKVRERANGNNSLAGSTESPDLALEHYVQQVWNIPAVLTVNSENATLEIVLAAAGVSDGTCVIMSALASEWMIATVNALGAEACLVDIDEATMTIDPIAVFQSINACTRAIIASHVCGFPPDMRKLMQMAGQYGISVIEDATWAAGGQYGGVRYSGQSVGSVGDYGYITCSPGHLAV
jgi:dTDP-4-amino-4,6-dideoxygalactose transaminase